MKNLQVLFGLLMFSTTVSTINAQVTAKESNATFGRFGNDCNSGRGVCAFNVQRVMGTGTSAKSAQKTSGNTFILKVKRSELTVQDEIRIAGKAFSEIVPNEKILFQQLDAITLDSNTVANLGFQASQNKIPAGYYPMSIFNEQVEVTFTVTP